MHELDRAALAESRVPRYTSYPPATQFSPAIGSSDAARWLAALPPDEPVSLYIHVPFCRQLCWYCGCHTSVVSRPEPVETYLELLLREIALVRRMLPARLSVAHLHLGGGTPTILAPGALGRLAYAITSQFALLPDAEFAIEADPRGLDAARIAALAASGVTRVSLGIQDLDPAVQAAINRVQPLALVHETVATLRAHGLTRIAMDLIYGLPHQTVATLRATIDDVAAMAADRVALFGYAHVPWMKPQQKMLEPHGLPGARARLALADAAGAALEAHGYRRIGMDHFARADDAMAIAARDRTLRRNFQGYTTDRGRSLIGFGASAISAFPDGFAQNAAKLDLWREALLRGELPTARGARLDADDRRRARLIERLMCDLEIDLAADRDLILDEDRLETLARDGLVRRDGARLRVTEAGRPFVRLVAAAFDRYLDRRAPRHAAAV